MKLSLSFINMLIGNVSCAKVLNDSKERASEIYSLHHYKTLILIWRRRAFWANAFLSLSLSEWFKIQTLVIELIKVFEMKNEHFFYTFELTFFFVNV